MADDLSARARFIETMAQLLERQGYYGTGLNEIVQHSGAPKGSLYHYFPGGKGVLELGQLGTVKLGESEWDFDRLELYLPDSQEHIDLLFLAR